MKVFQDEFEISTSKRTEAIDVTNHVNEAVKKSGVENGICLIFLPHATAALILNEAEAGLMRDVEGKVKDMFPQGAGYEHDRIDDNADSHLASAFIGQLRVLPVKGGALLRGTWQRPMVLELDGPRSRRCVVVTVIGK